MAKNIQAGAKILVIDDDELSRLTVKTIVKKTGYEVLEAGDGSEGVDIYRREKPTVVITDILMPVKEGLETIRDIRTLDTRVGIIAISGGGAARNMSFLNLARKAGADYAMEKPVQADDLLRMINALVRR